MYRQWKKEKESLSDNQHFVFVMGKIFEDWEKAFQSLADSVEKGLDEIRQCKAAVQSVTPEFVDTFHRGYYLRDDNRLIISAPEIVIGNLDKNGNLLANVGSKVTVRANSISLEGTSGTGVGTGSIVSRAGSIRNIAVDPGIDGKENVVGPLSEVVNKGRSISIDSCSDIGTFVETHSAGQGVSIFSESNIVIDASASAENKASNVNMAISSYKDQKNYWKKEVDTYKSAFKKAREKLSKLIDDCEKINDDAEELRSNEGFLEDKTNELRQVMVTLSDIVHGYIDSLSELAEACRCITSLEEMKKGLPKKDEFAKKTTGAGISLNSEIISLTSRDGDGKQRTNPEAGVSITAQSISAKSRDDDDLLLKDGVINLDAMKVNISTSDIKYKDKDKRDSGDVTAAGDLRIVSKNVLVEAVDYELSNKELKEKALTKESRLDVRMENVSVSATDTEGKATGMISLDAKQVEVKAVDVKKDDRKDDKMAAGGVLVLTAEKVLAGSRDKDHKAKQLQLAAEKTAVFGDNTTEVQQGEGKAIVQLDGGNLSISGSKTQLFGETTVNGKTAFKADITAPKAVIDNVEAKSSFKSTNINDGIAVPGAPSTAKLSAKLKQEENKAK